MKCRFIRHLRVQAVKILSPFTFIRSNVPGFDEQVLVFPSESSGITDDIRFQVKPPTDDNPSVFDFKMREQLTFELSVTGKNESQTDSKTFIINIQVKIPTYL